MTPWLFMTACFIGHPEDCTIVEMNYTQVGYCTHDVDRREILEARDDRFIVSYTCFNGE